MLRRSYRMSLLLLAIGSSELVAQPKVLPGVKLDLGAQAIGVVTRESPAVRGETLTEGYVTQPALMAELSAFDGDLGLKGTLNLEGVTIKRGELNAGIYGEGYVDRRHPHTYLHELVLTGAHDFRALSFSATAGKGFAPFGTDDPMARPFEKYPINHHLAQILERVVGIATIRAKNVALEAGLFNGDEPESPGDAPNSGRYWDSWSGRLTYSPFAQAELQASYARVESPENARGGGADNRKRSASIRLEDAQHSGYALFEWARTSDYVGADPTFSFTSFLGETEARFGRVRGGIRFERTERPDESRLLDPFRTSVPQPDLGIDGRSRWTIETARVSAPIRMTGSAQIEPFVEVARLRVSPTLTPSGFDPRQFYGSSRIWTASFGAKLALGMSHMRMGRYGAAIFQRGISMPGMDMTSQPAHKHQQQ
ncbi:MAG TPA: hypothetical protein VGO75_14205 [Gemmatimonadaceae bacterium]|nr:hypothetical protein [Gemmatimonadaceae bacterium]